MKVIITKQNADGSYDNCGMNNRRMSSRYKTIKGALRYAVPTWWRNCTCRFEFFHDQNFLAGTDPFYVKVVNL